MRKLIASTMMTVNGVQENPQDWSFDFWNDEIQKYAYDQLFGSDALFMGRVTYEGFAEAWSSRQGADVFADRMNALPKYVASRTLKEPLTWNSTLVKGDIVETFTKLKQEPGQDMLQYGIGELTHTLLKAGLIDELRLVVYPIAVGSGGSVFENIENTRLKLIETKTFSTGVIALHYQPA